MAPTTDRLDLDLPQSGLEQRDRAPQGFPLRPHETHQLRHLDFISGTRLAELTVLFGGRQVNQGELRHGS